MKTNNEINMTLFVRDVILSTLYNKDDISY